LPGALTVIVFTLLNFAASWLTVRLSSLLAGQNRTMSPETSSSSSLFPDRPIRPLPKRRLRERLSPEAAESIKYPPANQATTPLFLYPYTRDESGVEVSPSTTNGRGSEANGGRGNGANEEIDGHESGRDRHGSNYIARSHPEILTRAARVALKAPAKQEQARHPGPQSMQAVAASADLYDPFELNANNKKKRKIPSAGDSILNGSLSLNDHASGNSSSVDCHGDHQHSSSSGAYGSGSFVSTNQGISGPGRGRFGRVRSGRSPLRALSDANNIWAGRSSKARPGQWPSSASKCGFV
jgi:hypothetical protein